MFPYVCCFFTITDMQRGCEMSVLDIFIFFKHPSDANPNTFGHGLLDTASDELCKQSVPWTLKKSNTLRGLDMFLRCKHKVT